MQPIYSQSFTLSDVHVDCFGRLKTSMILYFAQEVAGKHFEELAMDYDAMLTQGLFWAITRHKVQVTRLPRHGEKVRIETWPMPTTRTAYPRSTVAYDQQGNELFRTMSLWILMNFDSRAMVLPDKSGVNVEGTLRGNELAAPRSVALKPMANRMERQVRFTDLDRNGHMNNTRYLEWIDDILPSRFHGEHPLADVTLCYLNEAREGQNLHITWDTDSEGTLLVDIHRPEGEDYQRIFAARMTFGNGVL